MCKIAIYICGDGGEKVAEAVERELAVMEVERVVDEIDDFDSLNVKRRIEQKIVPYIGKVDVIMLASYRATISALKDLRIKYPEQKFVGMSWPILPRENGTVIVLTDEMVRNSWAFMGMRRRWQQQGRVAVLSTRNWRGKIWTEDARQMLEGMRWLRPRNVVLGSVELLGAEDVVERIYRGVRVLDGRKTTLKNLCRALGIKDQIRVEKL